MSLLQSGRGCLCRGINLEGRLGKIYRSRCQPFIAIMITDLTTTILTSSTSSSPMTVPTALFLGLSLRCLSGAESVSSAGRPLPPRKALELELGPAAEDLLTTPEAASSSSSSSSPCVRGCSRVLVEAAVGAPLGRDRLTNVGFVVAMAGWSSVSDMAANRLD